MCVKNKEPGFDLVWRVVIALIPFFLLSFPPSGICISKHLGDPSPHFDVSSDENFIAAVLRYMYVRVIEQTTDFFMHLLIQSLLQNRVCILLYCFL